MITDVMKIISSTRSLMDRTEASDAFDAGSIPAGCICMCKWIDTWIENGEKEDTWLRKEIQKRVKCSRAVI